MPLVPPLSAFLLLLLPSFLRCSLLPSFDPVVPPVSSLPPFLYRILSRNIHPRWGSRGGRMSAGVLSSPGFFMAMLWRPETACEIRDMCKAVRAFAISFAFSFRSRFSFPIVRCVESRLREKIAYRVWRKV